MTFPPCLITDKTVSFYVDGEMYSVDRSAVVCNDIIDELKKAKPDNARLIELYDISKTVSTKIAAGLANDQTVNYLPKGIITADKQGVRFNGALLQNPLSDRLMDIIGMGLPIGPWIRFTEKLYMNPAKHARDELMDWLAASDLPITDDGHFLAYKRVRSDYKDIHSGTFDNSVGQIVQLKDRQAVDPNRNNHCSRGLHFCSKSYLKSYGGSSHNRTMILKIDPADVVSIPSDYKFAKGRTWRYEVIDEIPSDAIDAKKWEPVATGYYTEQDIQEAKQESLQFAFEAGVKAGFEQGKSYKGIPLNPDCE